MYKQTKTKKKWVKHDVERKEVEWNEEWNLIKIIIRATRTQFGVRILPNRQIDDQQTSETKL